MKIFRLASFERSGFAWGRAERIVAIIDVNFDAFVALVLDRKLRLRGGVHCKKSAGRGGEKESGEMSKEHGVSCSVVRVDLGVGAGLEKRADELVILIFRDNDLLAILHFSGAIIRAGIVLFFADLFFGRGIEFQTAALFAVTDAAICLGRSSFYALALLFQKAELVSARKDRDEDMFLGVILHGEARHRARI
ncbi:MAG: hypothetical protein AAFN76_06100 [Pseudomonadota bacterium]